MSTHPMYVCPRCGWGHYHPLAYCARCPGKLVRKEIPHPVRFDTEKQAIEHLRTQGVVYSGEYPKVPEEVKIARIKEKLLNAQLRCCMVSHREGYHPERSVDFWKKELKELEKKGF